jgi:hypothetical protein
MKTAPWTLLSLLTLLLSNAGQGSRPSIDATNSLESIAWMAGHWQQQGRNGLTEELWLPARGKMMIGVNRGVREGKKTSFEYLRIEEGPQGVTYLASPSGTKPTPFRLTEVDKTHAVFENPDHDFPKKIEYRLTSGKLVASIAGDKPGPSWTFERAGDVK